MKCRVLIADDHPILAEGLKMMIDDWESFEVCGLAADGSEAIELCGRLAPDIVIMDLRMPGLDGIGATRAIKQHHPRTKVLALTTFSDAASVKNALAAGCDGFLLKAIEPDKLRHAMQLLAEGISVFDESALETFQSAAQASSALSFTAREQQILQCVCEGMTNGEIAERMGLQTGTIKNLISLLLSKTNSISRSKLATYAVEHGLAQSGAQS